MKILDQIELFLDGTYSKIEQAEFIFKSRCICNYVERKIHNLDFETLLGRINIVCTKDKDLVGIKPLKGAPILEVKIWFDDSEFSNIDSKAVQDKYSEVIRRGLVATQGFMPVPLLEINGILDEFISGGYVNRWVHAEKSWEKICLRCVVMAELTIEKFCLTQIIYNEKIPISEKSICNTKPREMLFLRYLGRLHIENGNILIYKKGDVVLYRYDLSSKLWII